VASWYGFRFLLPFWPTPRRSRPGRHWKGGRAELYHTRRQRLDAGLKRKITERITLSGLIEVETLYEVIGEGADTRDLIHSQLAVDF